MTVPLVNLKAQYEDLKPEIDSAINEVITSSAFIGGPYLKSFEDNFADFCEVKYSVGVSSGTTALVTALHGLKIGRGDEVITTPYTFVATVEAIIDVGAKPVLVDIKPESYNIDPGKIEEKITPRTKAIIPVHIYGHPVDMDPVLGIAGKHNLTIIEDTAQAHGARYKGRRAGSMGTAGAFSFYPGKNLGAYGDAGAVVTNDEKLAKRMRMLTNHGRVRKYEHDFSAYNYRMDSLQAAILDVKLKYLEDWNNKRRLIAEKYRSLLVGLPHIKLPSALPGVEHVYHLYVIRVPRRDALMQKLKNDEIDTGVHYSIPIHLQQAFRYLGYNKGDFPVAEEMCGSVLSLPIHPELATSDIERICSKVKEHLGT